MPRSYHERKDRPMTDEELLRAIDQAVEEKAAELDLSESALTTLPPEIAHLTNLEKLVLWGNQLTTLPNEIGQLTNLEELDLDQNQLTTLPSEIGQPANLQSLRVSENQLTTLPNEIAQLANLRRLDVSENQLTSLPTEIAQLTNLVELILWGNELTTLPNWIGQLTNLVELILWDNELTTVPNWIGQLTNLKELDLDQNQLTTLPTEIGQLTNLQSLLVNDNQLTTLPTEIVQLNNLKRLDIGNNQLTTLPPEIGKLEKLQDLQLDDNPLTFPPPEIVEQGAQAVLTFLREHLRDSERQWVSKLLLVGEGGVGKTSVLRALLGESFDTQESSTHGIEVRGLEIEHPEEPGVTMNLSAWDFGGQEIYHATHQFFLSNRSLYLLVWNSRHGWEQGKLFYWLDMIKAKAPDSPVIIVAAHIEDRAPDLPLDDLRDRYPNNIVDSCAVSNRDGTGIDQLREVIRNVAAGLPLMGESWPTTWTEARRAVRDMPETHVNPEQMYEVIGSHGVTGDDAQILAQWLHDLGDIVYFQDTPELTDIVILDPQWLTSYMSRVLDSTQVERGLGILRRDHMETLWGDLDYGMASYFLRLMEQFDLSYRTLEDDDISIVVERLSHNPPEFDSRWNSIKEDPKCREISLKFELNATMPPGIPTWFIARSHRFTTGNHWRYGALLEDGREPKHVALVRAFLNDRYLQLSVRGPYPQQMFYILRDGLEYTLARYPGLHIGRKVPCPGHEGQSCTHEFELEHLTMRLDRKRLEIECPKSLEMVSVPKLLFGLHLETTQTEVISRIDSVIEGKQLLGDKIDELTKSIELYHLQFLNEYRDVQKRAESRCPNVFVLIPSQGSWWTKRLLGQKIDLQLLCQAPGQWHPTTEDGRYSIPEPPKWLAASAPYLQRLLPVLKATAPLIMPFAGAVIPDFDATAFKKQVDLTTQLLDKLPDFLASSAAETPGALAELPRSERLDPAQLRTVRMLLEELDPYKRWGGLQAQPTPEGHYLWLCDYHAREYRR